MKGCLPDQNDARVATISIVISTPVQEASEMRLEGVSARKSGGELPPQCAVPLAGLQKARRGSS